MKSPSIRSRMARAIGVALPFLACLAFITFPSCQRPEKKPPPQIQRLTQSQLDAATYQLSKATFKNLYFKTYEFDQQTQEYRGIRGGSFMGVITKFPIDQLKPTAYGFWSDGHFNLISSVIAAFPDQRKARIQIAWTPAGDIIVGVQDISKGPDILALIAKQNPGLISILTDMTEIEDLNCFDQAVKTGSIEAILKCLNVSIPGGSPGGFDSFVDGLSQPDCSDSGLGPVSQTDPDLEERINKVIAQGETPMDTVKKKREFADWLRDHADGVDRAASDPRNEATRADREEYADDLREEAIELDEAADAQEDRERLDSDPNSTPEEIDRALEREQQERNDYEEARERRNNTQGRIRGKIKSEGGSTVDPAVGGPEPVSDPRCQGLLVDAARGTLFTNPDFCRGLDMISCIQYASDAVFRITEGQCWIEPEGPDDGPQLVCEESPTGIRVPGIDGSMPGCPDDDPTCWTDPNAPRSSGNIQTRYLDISPLGPFLAAICSQGGCPDPIP